MYTQSDSRTIAKKTASVLLSCMLLLTFLTAWIKADEEPSSDTTQQTDITDTQPGSDTFGHAENALLDPEPSDVPQADARAYLVFDALSDTMLIGKDYEATYDPSSITQVMTILLALERLQLSDQITISKEMYETIPDDYVRIGFTEGEVVTVEECLYACVLKSANDACMALAVHISGDEKSFVNLMNDRAKELGCVHTNFTTPYGKDDPDHVTTCRDLALILKQVLKYPDYVKVATTTSYTMNPTNKYNDKRILNNGNRFISTPAIAYEYYIGGKTGYSNQSGYMIVAGAEKEGRRLVGILLGAGNAEMRYDDLMKLLEYCFAKYATTRIERSEFSELEESTLSKINTVLENTPLKIDSTEFDVLDYYSIPMLLANSGYSNDIELSGVVIDPKKDQQDIRLPVYRNFSDNKSFHIGYLKIHIVNKDAGPADKEKQEDHDSISIVTILIIAVVGIFLLAIIVGAITLYVKMTRKRHFRKNHKNPRIL